jgi:hypothetical protein
MYNTETRSLSLTLHKNQFKIDQTSYHKTWNVETTKGKYRVNTLRYRHRQLISE